jgi:hypothetical protein
MNKQEFRKLIREEIKKVINEGATPKSGQKLSDDELSDKGYLGDDDIQQMWFELFSDEGDVNSSSRKRFITMANKFLKSNKLNWQVSGIVAQDEDGIITWIIK